MGSQIIGLAAQSTPNTAAYSYRGNVLNGPAEVTIQSGKPGAAKSFKLKRLYFGCVGATAESAASTPISCTITITAFKNNVQVDSAQSTFTRSALPVSPLKQFDLPASFKSSDMIRFATKGLVKTLTTATLIDNVQYAFA